MVSSKKTYMIKIYSFLVLCLISATPAFCQFEKGQKILGGDIGFSSGKSQNVYSNNYTSAYSNVSINPSFGWFSKADKLWGMGLSYGFNYQKNNSYMSTDISRIWRNTLGINIFSRKFFTLTHNFFFTVNTNGGFGYAFGKQKNTTNSIETEGKTSGYGIAVSLTPGLSYRLTPRLLFDANLSNLINAGYSYNQTKGKDASGADVKTFDKGFSFSTALSNTSLGNVGLGFMWLLRKK